MTSSATPMTDKQVSLVGRKAYQETDWDTVNACSQELLRRSNDNPEGYFLKGLVEKVSRHPVLASEAFGQVLQLDPSRYDAGIELASQYVISQRNAEAITLLDRYCSDLANSPRYLDMAGTAFTDMGLAARAWPLYAKANALQPEIELFKANLAACSVFLGKIDEARQGYLDLLAKKPQHQRNHYHLARLEKTPDDRHINQMKAVLANTNLPPDRNIFMYYALGKELEDLARWDEAFHYFKLAGDAVSRVSNYDIQQDETLINKIIQVCDKDWLATGTPVTTTEIKNKTPVFILGLPRTGTTLTERILSSHSQVESLGETKFLESVLRNLSGVPSIEKMTPEMISALGTVDPGLIANGYLNAVNYLFGDKPLFIEKLPYNFLYIGFIAKAYPKAPIIRLKRNPMDSCFAIYKQPFTWAYKFSYKLEDLGRYYIAQQRLFDHWREVLGDRLIEVDYEDLVADQEVQTRQLLEKVGLEFETACLNFDQNASATTTASSVQVREKIHSRSVQRWREFETQLSPLRRILEDAGINVE